MRGKDGTELISRMGQKGKCSSTVRYAQRWVDYNIYKIGQGQALFHYWRALAFRAFSKRPFCASGNHAIFVTNSFWNRFHSPTPLHWPVINRWFGIRENVYWSPPTLRPTLSTAYSGVLRFRAFSWATQVQLDSAKKTRLYSIDEKSAAIQYQCKKQGYTLYSIDEKSAALQYAWKAFIEKF